jgi:hypothetical protein
MHDAPKMVTCVVFYEGKTYNNTASKSETVAMRIFMRERFPHLSQTKAGFESTGAKIIPQHYER